MQRWLLRNSQLAICLIAGCCAAIGFGYIYRGLAWTIIPISLAILFVYVTDTSPKRAAILGYLYGLGLYGVGLNWTHVSLHEFGGLALPAALFIALGFAAFLALFPALACMLGRYTSRNLSSWLTLLNLAAAWTLLEYIRSFLFTGFGWLALGYSQVPYSPLAGFVPFIGIFGVTALTAAFAGLISQAMYFSMSVRAAAVPQMIMLLVLLAGLGIKRVEQTQVVGEPLAVSILQGAIPQEQLWLQDNLAYVVDTYLELGTRAHGQLIVAPESALPFMWEQYPAKENFTQLLAQLDATLIFGTFDQVDNQPRNVAVVLQADTQQTYAKRHLVPYGEYLPFADFLEPILHRAQIPYSQLHAGSGSGIIELPFVQLGMSICYESLFPQLFAAPPAEVLVNITNDAWFAGSAMAAQHLQIAASRALETGRWLIRASNPGPSAIISPQGRVRRFLAPGVRNTINTTIERRTGTTMYTEIGDWPLLILVALILGVRVKFH